MVGRKGREKGSAFDLVTCLCQVADEQKTAESADSSAPAAAEDESGEQPATLQEEPLTRPQDLEDIQEQVGPRGHRSK